MNWKRGMTWPGTSKNNPYKEEIKDYLGRNRTLATVQSLRGAEEQSQSLDGVRQWDELWPRTIYSWRDLRCKKPKAYVRYLTDRIHDLGGGFPCSGQWSLKSHNTEFRSYNVSLAVIMAKSEALVGEQTSLMSFRAFVVRRGNCLQPRLYWLGPIFLLPSPSVPRSDSLI